MVTLPCGTAFLPFTSTLTADGFPSTILTGWRSFQLMVLPGYTVPLNSVAPETLVSWTQQFLTAVSLMCRRCGRGCAWCAAAGEVEVFGLEAVDGLCTRPCCLVAAVEWVFACEA